MELMSQQARKSRTGDEQGRLYNYELTKVGSDQRSSTIQYDSKSKHSKRRQTVIRSRQYARARTDLFLKGISAAIFSLRSCTACARVLSLCMSLPARARGRRPRQRLGCSRPLGGSAAKWTNVVWPIKSRQTNKHTLLFYRYR